jgi:hypothetical protein
MEFSITVHIFSKVLDPTAVLYNLSLIIYSRSAKFKKLYTLEIRRYREQRRKSYYHINNTRFVELKVSIIRQHTSSVLPRIPLVNLCFHATILILR